MSSTFPTLATEIIELITTFLKLADLRSLRLVCHQLNRKTLTNFGRAAFATIQTDLSSDSLERIRRFSDSDHFARHVQCLQVNFSHWPRHDSGCLAGNSRGADLLRGLLSQRLQNCRSFLVYAYGESWDERTNRVLLSDAVGLILSLVAEADLALRSFNIKSDGNCGWLDTPRLQMSLSNPPKFIKAWSRIEELGLDFALALDQWDWVLHLISLTVKLRKLSLGLYEVNTSFMQRLSSLHELNRLEELSVGEVRVTVDAITSLLLQNRDTLHSLSLDETSLQGEGRWSTVLQNMKSQFPQLQNLLLFKLRQGYDNDRIIFSKLSKYSVIPGSEVQGPINCLKYDSRRIESMADPVRIRYQSRRRLATGFDYHGKEIDQVFSVLIEVIGTVEAGIGI